MLVVPEANNTEMQKWSSIAQYSCMYQYLGFEVNFFSLAFQNSKKKKQTNKNKNKTKKKTTTLIQQNGYYHYEILALKITLKNLEWFWKSMKFPKTKRNLVTLKFFRDISVHFSVKPLTYNEHWNSS